MNKFITLFKPNRKASTVLVKTNINEWKFSGFSIPTSQKCETIEEMAAVHDKYFDKFIQNVSYSTLDKTGLASYIRGLEKFMQNKPTETEELNILWENNPANIKIKVQFIPDGKFRDHENQKWVVCPMYRIIPFIQNKYSKHFAYNPDDPMLDSRPEFSPEGFSGRQLDVLGDDLNKYIAELKAEYERETGKAYEATGIWRGIGN